MNFDEAYAKLKELAAGEYCSLAYEKTYYRDAILTSSTARVKAYINNFGWTDSMTTYEDCLLVMSKRMLAKQLGTSYEASSEGMELTGTSYEASSEGMELTGETKDDSCDSSS